MLAELRITPVGGSTPFAHLVAEVLPILKESPLQYHEHAMGTTLEGELEDILGVLRRCHETVRRDAERVLIELSIDDRAGAEGELVRSVEHVRELAEGAPTERLTRGGGV